jgi:hypothetical protein
VELFSLVFVTLVEVRNTLVLENDVGRSMVCSNVMLTVVVVSLQSASESFVELFQHFSTELIPRRLFNKKCIL